MAGIPSRMQYMTGTGSFLPRALSMLNILNYDSLFQWGFLAWLTVYFWSVFSLLQRLNLAQEPDGCAATSECTGTFLNTFWYITMAYALVAMLMTLWPLVGSYLQ